MQAATAIVGMVVFTAVIFVVVQTLALRAKREYGDDAFAPVWTMGMGVAGLFTTAWVWRWLKRNFADRDARLARSVRVDAAVTGIKTTGTKGKDGYTERPILRYEVPGAARVEHQSAFQELGLEVGQIVAVRVDPIEPAWVALDTHDHAKDMLAIKGFAAALVAVGVISIAVGAVWFTQV